MGEQEQKPGVWYRDGRTVYLLRETTDLGPPILENKFSAQIYAGRGISKEEAELIAEMFRAAPETAAENERLREVLEKIADNTHDEESREIARAALAKAEAAQ